MQTPFCPAVGKGKSKMIASPSQACIDDMANPLKLGGSNHRIVAGDDNVVFLISGRDHEEGLYAAEIEKVRIVEVDLPPSCRFQTRLLHLDPKMAQSNSGQGQLAVMLGRKDGDPSMWIVADCVQAIIVAPA